MDIDWNKDVEGEFGDTRRRLYPLKNDLGEVVAVDDLSRVWRLDSPDCPRIRNVAPKPVRHERYVALYANKIGELRPTKRDAELASHGREDLIEIRRIVWHSDGSPVDDTVSQEEYDRVRAERDALKAECAQWQEKAEKALDLLTRVNDERERLIAAVEKHVVKSCDNCANGPMHSTKCRRKPCSPNYGSYFEFTNWEPKR